MNYLQLNAAQQRQHPETISSRLLDLLLLLEDRFQNGQALSKEKIAVLDLDNTLLIGDIGEAVFAQLKVTGHSLSIEWDSYQRLLFSRNRKEAYARVVSAMAGLTQKQVEDTTYAVLSSSSNWIVIKGSFVSIPKANPIMKKLVDYLNDFHYRIYVISSSNEISARITAFKLFGIPTQQVFGIRPIIHDGILTSSLHNPLPIEEGKIEVHRKNIGDIVPFITAGDSPNDISMLQLTDPEGLTIWVGEEKIGFEVAKGRIGGHQNFYFISRNALETSAEQVNRVTPPIISEQ